MRAFVSNARSSSTACHAGKVNDGVNYGFTNNENARLHEYGRGESSLGTRSHYDRP